MRKRTRIVLALALGIALGALGVLGLGVTSVYATGTGAIEIDAPSPNNEGSGVTHSFHAYQVFAGDYSNGELSNVTWGTGVNGAAFLAATNSVDTAKTNAQVYGANAEAVAAKLATFSNDDASAKAFAAEIAKYLSTTTSGTGAAGTGANGYPYTISGLDAGYYLVKDAANLEGANGAYTRFILRVAGTGTEKVAAKSNVPTPTKQVDERNTSSSTGNTYPLTYTGVDGNGGVADYAIGDYVPYKVTMTLGSDYADYSTYDYTITDTLPTTLDYAKDNATYPTSVFVTIGGTTYYLKADATTGYTLAYDTATHKLTIYVKDLKTVALYTDAACTTAAAGTVKVTATSILGTTYYAQVNATATPGTPMQNEVYGTYPNNPNGSGHGETTHPHTNVYTYALTINKTDANGVALAGAKFKLQKLNGQTKAYEDVSEQGNGTTDTTFSWTGLDAGSYKLVETTTPAGYNTMSDVTFDLVSTFDTSNPPVLTGLALQNLVDPSGVMSGVTPTVATGTVSANVKNTAGSILPSTGGMGTTVLYVVGALLVVGAGALLASKKHTRDDR
jgi:fimbrial isopeptide formation D2 family protein/LPXTG-motif cell wall-anchored protein